MTQLEILELAQYALRIQLIEKSNKIIKANNLMNESTGFNNYQKYKQIAKALHTEEYNLQNKLKEVEDLIFDEEFIKK